MSQVAKPRCVITETVYGLSKSTPNKVRCRKKAGPEGVCSEHRRMLLTNQEPEDLGFTTGEP